MNERAGGEWRVGEWRVNPALGEISRGAELIRLDPRTMRLLMSLADRAGQVVSVPELLEFVWPDVVVTPKSVYEAIAALRHALGDHSHDPTYLANLPRRGYRLIAAVNPWVEARGSHTLLAGPSVPATQSDPKASVKSTRSQASLGAGRGRPVFGWGIGGGLAAGLGLLLLLGPLRWHRQPPVPVPPPERSVAVLPFANLSPDPEQEYFSDGLTEELTDRLTRVPGLRVAGRTSSFSFRGKNATAAEIGKALSVGTLLEGSIRKGGDAVRITAQLVQTTTGYELWSETYDRNLNDVFATQDQIATAVTRALHVRLLSAPVATRGNAENAEAYNLLLQARFYGRQGKHELSRDCYQRALAIDAGYALAWAWLSNEMIYDWWPRIDARAGAAARRAVELDPSLPDGHIALSFVYATAEYNWDAAQAELKLALSLDPSNTWATIERGGYLMWLGRQDEAIPILQRAADADPLNPIALTGLSNSLRLAGRLTDAEEVARRALTVSPDENSARWALLSVLLAKGDVKAALAEVDRVPNETHRLLGRTISNFAAGHFSESDRALAELTAKHRQDTPWLIAAAHAYRHEADAAFLWLGRAYRQRHADVIYLKSSDMWISLRGDPRYREWLRKVNLPE